VVLCKYCGSEGVVKDGVVKGKQRYLCRKCNRTSRCGDNRERYSMEERLQVMKLYTEGVGIRAIERITGVPAPLLVHWVRNFGKMIKEKLLNTGVPDDVKEIEILEVDELFTYYKKKHKKHMFGLLWTETGIKLLIL
jgi:transposase-like protein